MGLQLRTRDGTLLDVPATLKAITTFVLLEQEQWFEKELGFLLAWLKPDMTAIDIGANLGVYSLPLARRVRSVVAFEPGREARAHLEVSRTLNAASNLEIIPAAVSDFPREGHLMLGATTEVSRLGDDEEGETVAVTALDQEDAERSWSPDFVKLDAEGEELKIIEGGQSFFTHHSPVVMFEVRTERSINWPAVSAFAALGYRSYRSLPGAAVLIPCEPDEPTDPYELNFFALKPDRAESLARQGFLFGEAGNWTPSDAAREAGLSLLKTQQFSAPFLALHKAPIDRAYQDALAGYAAWRMSRNYGALAFAVGLLSDLCETAPNMARLSTLARIAWEAGQRGIAVKSLSALRDQMKTGAGAITEPFWPVAPRSEAVPPAAPSWSDWFITQALEQNELLTRYSSYWGASELNLEWLCRHPWVATEIFRRQALNELRAGTLAKMPERLCRAAPDHLNAGIWRSGQVQIAARND